MILFQKEKELIWKITNAVLLIWFVGALVFTAGSIINLILKEPVPTFEEYKVTDGIWMKEEAVKEDLSDAEMEARLKAQYNQMYGNRDYYNLRSMYVSIANVIIVGGALAVINRGDRKTQA